MATTQTEGSTGRRVQSWVPVATAKALERHAAEERRSVSSMIRIAIEDRLREGRRS